MKDCPICNEVGGPLVECVECGMPKVPRGRSVAPELLYCDWDCPGHDKDPRPSELWPGERYGDSFGHMDWHDEYKETTP